jgi:hypothetical protein
MKVCGMDVELVWVMGFEIMSFELYMGESASSRERLLWPSGKAADKIFYNPFKCGRRFES